MKNNGILLKSFLSVTMGILAFAMLTGCSEREDKKEDATVHAFNGVKIVGRDIMSDDISEFYYTEENINYNAYYQRYRFYKEDGKHMFFHETRERKDDYGPCTEDDTTKVGTVELSADDWNTFCDLISEGTVTRKTEDLGEGDDGPWLYLYWNGDNDEYREYAFESYGKLKEFEKFCEGLAQ